MKDKARRELLRVGLPLEVGKLRAVLDAVTTDDATVRHYNGMLIVEAPELTLSDT